MNFVFNLDSLFDRVLLVFVFLVALYMLQWCLFSAATIVNLVFAVTATLALYVGLPLLVVATVLRMIRG